jgi:GMP synthase-like glutamine amidotransferase
MGLKIENYVPVVKIAGLNTDKAVTFGSTLEVTGAITATGGVVGGISGGTASVTTLTASGLTKTPNPVLQQTITVIDAQNGTPTIAQILGGIVTHNSKTGGGTLTVPTGTAMSAGISGVAVGSTIKWLYYNYGNQTVTVTAADGHTLVGGTAAVTNGKHIYLTSTCSAANTWVTYLTTLM